MREIRERCSGFVRLKCLSHLAAGFAALVRNALATGLALGWWETYRLRTYNQAKSLEQVVALGCQARPV